MKAVTCQHGKLSVEDLPEQGALLTLEDFHEGSVGVMLFQPGIFSRQ